MRKVQMLTFLVLLALVISGAGAAMARQDDVELTLMGWSSSTLENDALAAQVAAFEEANPDITVNVNLVPDYDHHHPGRVCQR